MSAFAGGDGLEAFRARIREAGVIALAESGPLFYHLDSVGAAVQAGAHAGLGLEELVALAAPALSRGDVEATAAPVLERRAAKRAREGELARLEGEAMAGPEVEWPPLPNGITRDADGKLIAPDEGPCSCCG